MSLDAEHVHAPSDRCDPAEIASDREVVEALDQLPEHEREAVFLTKASGLSIREAAIILGVSRSTVAERVSSGLTTLRKRLGVQETVILRSLTMLPIAQPPGGLEAATTSWIAAANTHAIAGTSAGIITNSTIGGILMANKATVIIVAAASLLTGGIIGIAAVTAGEERESPTPLVEEPIESDLNQSAQEIDDLRSEINRLRQEVLNRDAAFSAKERNSSEQSDDILQLHNEKHNLLRRIDDLTAQADLKKPESLKPKLIGNPVTIEIPELSIEERNALRTIDWRRLAGAAHVLNRFTIQPPTSADDVQQRLDAREAISKQLSLLDGKFRTGMVDGVRRNGHLVYLLNLMATRLEQAGDPLSQRQVDELTQLAAAYVDEINRIENTKDTRDSFVLQEAYQRLDAGLRHMQAAKKTLSLTQYDLLFDPATENTVQDPFSPTYVELDRYNVISLGDTPSASDRSSFDNQVFWALGLEDLPTETVQRIPPDCFQTWWSSGIDLPISSQRFLGDFEVLQSLLVQVNAIMGILERGQWEPHEVKLFLRSRNMLLFTTRRSE